MKNLIFIIFLVLSTGAFAQLEVDSTKISNDSTKIFHLSSIDLSSGKGAITSGLYLSFSFENKKTILLTTISEKDLSVAYFYRLFGDKLLIGPSMGYFYNIPWAGPEIIFSPIKLISTFHWFGFSPGVPDGQIEPAKSIFLFGVNSISLNVWRLQGTYCLINYMNNKPQHTVSLKYSQKVNSNFLVYTDVGYDFLNQGQLLKIGITWKR